MNAISVIQYLATGVVAGLTAAYAYYPHQLWIPIALAVAGTLGIHVIPSQLQVRRQLPPLPPPGQVPPPAA